MKLEFTGGEDDILKKFEAGNVSLPLNSTLISGSQSLFGIKTVLQFGKATVTTVFSQEKSQKKEIKIEGGAQTSKFEINADNYEANKHFFLAQHFKDRYDSALQNLPIINSGISINKVEIWVTNTSSNINETRNIIALTDLGENKKTYISNPITIINANNGVPDNSANTLNPKIFVTNYPSIRNKDSVAIILGGLGLKSAQDFEKILSARKLSTSEFTFNPRLGFVSLNSNINPDQVVAVAFEYTYNGGLYQVGELSTDGVADPKCLMVKMLKSTNVSTRRDTLLWDLMMKNVYSMGAYQVKAEDFKLEVFYNNPATGTNIPIIPETGLPTTGKPLIQVMNLDRINSSGDARSDGVFDFIDGVTINAANGRIYFPVRKPFGENLRHKINPTNNSNTIALEKKYAYDQLYDSTKFAAQQFPDKNRFIMKGSYKSTSGSEISLNAANIPEGSVAVTAGGVPLVENEDYTVDYSLGKLKIINDGILQSGTPIKVSFENNVLFGFQQKSLIGSHLDYRVNKDFNFGATALRLNERPIMQKVNIGDEPIKNTVFGMDGNYRTEFPFLTRLIDKIPLYSTKEMSTVVASGEVAALVPGHSKAIGKEGNAYLDDFEGSQSPIDIKAFGAWSLASTPQGNIGKPNPLWPEGIRNDSVYGFNRAKLAWHTIDPIFMRGETQKLTPAYYTKALMSDNFQREVYETELFPKKQSQTGQPMPLPTLDLAFYPTERGPYNYDAAPLSGFSAGTKADDGSLLNPKSRWGGIMRTIATNDFEAANVQFIQIWMMDPFNSDCGSPYNKLDPKASGELILQLGNISEDVLKDGKRSFENGLPTSSSDQTHPTENTPWGKMPKIQSIVNAFDNDPNSRTAQDVGLDGLNNTDEEAYFSKFINAYQGVSGISSTALSAIKSDPSSDVYHYYRGDDYDNLQLGTLDRYKNFNGLEGNSPVGSTTSSTTLPSTEDINRDNNLSENEGYYQYRVKISANDLTKNKFITDVVNGGGSTIDNTAIDAKWYQLKIPIKEFEAKYGNIEDFRSIRFIRMILRGFDKPVVLRMARLELIRNEWRKCKEDLAKEGEYIGDDNTGTSFDVSAVNYEENGTKVPVNYVLPPKIEQQLSYGPSNPIPQNEQAMALKVCDLVDGDARAAFKNVNFDVRSYKKLKMYVHAEAQAAGSPLRDNELTCFVRLGTDYTQNYYEYEIPLKVTPAGSYKNISDVEREYVWKNENELDLDFSVLQDVKQMRNSKTIELSKRYSIAITDANGHSRNVFIKGNPNLSDVKTIMIGIRNPEKSGISDNDDGLTKCAEIWVNELRLSEFDEKGGWASTARVTTKLADLGTVTLAGNYSTPGWGSIEKKISERQRETRYQYDISAQLLLHKFIPENWRINLPMYIGYSQAIIRPQYNPLDPDMYFKNALSILSDSAKKDLRQRTIDETNRKSINFTNVKKERPKDSKRNNIYDIENFSFNYSYSELFNRSATIDHNNMRDYRASVIYGYSTNPKNIQPFKNVKWMSKKAFALIKDFNFNPYPEKYSFMAEVNRHYVEKLQRNTTGLEIPMIPFFDKNFNMVRSYDLKYDLTKSLKLDFHADNNSRIMEAPGAIDTQGEKDTIRTNLLKGGDNVMYTHLAKADYTIPINKIGITDWISANAGYSTNYKWQRAPYSANAFGGTIQNGNQKSLNVQANMLSLYNKVPFLKKVNQGIKKEEDKKKKKAKLKVTTVSTNTAIPTSPAIKDTTKKKKPFLLPQYFARTLMMVKNISGNYTNNEGMALSGYDDSTKYFGMHQGKNGLAPGPGFVFGQQSNFGDQKLEFTDYAANRGWLKKASNLNTPFTKNITTNITARANIEPIPSFKIELTANKNISKNNSEFFRWGLDSTLKDSNFVHFSPTEAGNFSMSFITWSTAFEKIKKNYESDAFSKFLDNRSIISQNLADKYNNSKGTVTGLDGKTYNLGYGPTSQSTLMYSFLAAYSGKNSSKYPLEVFPKMPAPNWRVTYDGLSKWKPLKKYVKSVTLSHAYRSSYSFSYTNNLKSGLGGTGGKPKFTEDIPNGDYIFYEQISSISIAEQLSPLIKVDVTLQNNLQFNFAVKKERNLALSFANNQLTEVNSNEFVFGTGYRWKDIELKNPFGKTKSKKGIKSDLNLKMDFSIRQNLTMIRKVAEAVTQPTAGQTIFSLRTSADYLITQRITLRLFYDWLLTNPRISTSFKSSNTNGGVSIRFTLN
jgi:cell surface protein SprA